MAKSKKKSTFSYIIVAALLALGITLLLEPALRLVYPLDYREAIEESAEAHNLDPFLVMGVISTESGFDPHAQSHKNAHGLMQIKDDTALWCIENLSLDIAPGDIRKPEANIRIGCAYLEYLKELYDGNMTTAIAAYNAGPGNVGDWLSDKRYSDGGTVLTKVPFGETEAYIDKVEKRTKLYAGLYD